MDCRLLYTYVKMNELQLPTNTRVNVRNNAERKKQFAEDHVE